MTMLLAMSEGKNRPDKVQVTIQRIVGRQVKFLRVNREYKNTIRRSLQDVREFAWPAGDFNGWIPRDDDKVRLFVLVYFSVGYEFL